MSHEEMHDALGAYVDGELDAARRAALEAHLAGCAECRGELEALRDLDQAIRSQPVPDPGPQYWSRFADRVAARSEPHAEGGRFYDRLTGWLFPGERFAWVRAATAVAACTLLVTLGLRGFRSIETASRAPSEIGPPPAAESPNLPVPPTNPPEPRANEAGEEPKVPGRAKHEGAQSASREAAPPPTVRRDAESAPQPAPGPGEPAARGISKPLGSAAPEPQATESRESIRQQEPLVVAPKPSPPAAEPQDETGAAGRSAPAIVQKHTLAPRELAVAPPSAPGVLDSLVPPVQALEFGKMQVRGQPIERKVRFEDVETPVESLLARDARLWPRRDEPEERPQIAALATELAARADDPRLRPRAVAYLEHLLATSTEDAERESWRRMLGSLGDR